MRFILASSSPRRSELLRGLGYELRIILPQVTEIEDGDALSIAVINARYKAEKVFKDYVPGEDELIVAADTVVSCEDRCLGKPKSPADAIAMLAFLSGREHEVITAFCLIKNADYQSESHVISKINFRTLNHQEISAYVQTGECMDKSGSYAINGLGAALIDNIKGSVTNIIGLPIKELLYEANKLIQHYKRTSAAHPGRNP